MINLNSLNKNQREAVETLNGPILCIAGAGSGKTTTLTYRVANLIENGINPSSILLLTFTKKAAKEMLDRVIKIVGEKGKLVEGGTFHHFAALIISMYGERFKIKKNFTVLDDNDSMDIIQSIRDYNSDYFNKYNLCINKYLIFQIISKSRSCVKKISDIIKSDYDNLIIDSKAIEYINSLYTDYKQKNNLLDYDDLLEYLYRLLLIKDIQKQVSELYKYIMVDEYQDTNLTQSLITKLLSEIDQNIMVVGDDSQSIYSFRGSRIDNILSFSNNYDNCKIIKLEKNYRSYGYILRGCNSLINYSSKSIKKKLFTDKPDGNKIILVKCLSEKEEAALITHKILSLYNLGYSLNDIAVLFRNSNYSFELELELARKRIPYKKFGGPKIFDSKHFRDILCYLRILNNPYDKISWLRALTIIKGIGIQTATKIYENQIKQPEPFEFSSIRIKSDIKLELNKLSLMLVNCSKNLTKKPSFILNFIIDYYISTLKKQNANDIQNKIKDLDQIFIIAEKYATLQGLLEEIFLDKSENETISKNNKNNMFLNLSTIHSAKGLEFKFVFIISALEGRFPSFSSQENLEQLEEERRLMYVAMTRAIEGLMITYPSGIWDKSSREFLTKPSRFINEISAENIEVWQIKH